MPSKGAPQSVLQDWVAELSFMQQSVLLTAVRGPDGLPKYHTVKWLLRWYRRCVLRSSFLGVVISNPVESDGGSFLGPSLGSSAQGFPAVPFDDDSCDYLYTVEEWDAYLAEHWQEGMTARATAYVAALDEVPHHFQLHLMHAAEIVGYKHPDAEIRAWWRGFYLRLAHDLHLWPETAEQLDSRLGDSREGWLARGDVATEA